MTLRSALLGVRGTVLLALAMSCARVAGGQEVLQLFNGTSLLGWTPHGPWSASGGSLSTNGTGTRTLLTAVPFGDFDLRFEFMESAPANATFRMWTSPDGTGGITVNLDNAGSQNGVGGIVGLSRSSLSTLLPGSHRVIVQVSQGTLSVMVDGQPAGSASGVGSKAGYLGFETSGTGTFSVRSIQLRPLNLPKIFNGSDLGDWKSVASSPESKGGLSHTTEKVFSFGMAGGSTKPHEAKWTVKNGAIHGESGPGGLEYKIPAGDQIIRVAATVKGSAKKDNFTSLAVRNTSGQLGTGYPIGIGPYAGTVEHLNQSGYGRTNGKVDETFVIGGRTIATWVGGNLVSVVSDPRPESNNAEKGARTQAGTTQIFLSSDKSEVDISQLDAAVFAQPYGLAPRASAPVLPPPPAAGGTPAAVAGANDSAATQAILQQQQTTQQKNAQDEANKQRVASLMSQALTSSDPQQQESLYGQVIQIDPSNPNAMQGYKDAQGKLQQQQTAQAQQNTSESDEKQKGEQANQALMTAQSAFLGGHISDASNALGVAERLTPGNPMVRELRNRIGAAQSLRTRMYFLGGGVGVVALLGAVTLWWRRRRMQRFPALEVTTGLDAGAIFRIEKDQTRIGAVPQDGGQKNDIVIRDVEHAVSRFHCEVVKKNGQLYLQDLNSSNGTRVDGERLKPGQAALLRKGTKIELGGTVEMRFMYERAAKQS